MAKLSKLSKAKIAQLVGAKRHEPVRTPFYYAPPFLDEVRKSLEQMLSSSGGRPTVSEWEIVRKTRFSKRTWTYLQGLAKQWSRGGVSVSPSQVAARIVEQACHGMK